MLEFASKAFRQPALHIEKCRAIATRNAREFGLAQSIGKLPPRHGALAQAGNRSKSGEKPLFLQSIKVPLSKSIFVKRGRPVRQCKPRVPRILGKDNGNSVANFRGHHSPRTTRNDQKEGG